MNYFKWLFLIILTFLAQTQFSIFYIPLNLPVVLVYFFSLKSLPTFDKAGSYFGSRAETGSTLFGVFIGFIEDIISGSVIGPALFSKGFIGLISIILFTEVVFKWTPLLGAIVIGIFTVIDGLIITGLRLVFSDANINMLDVLRTIAVQVIVNVPFGIIFKPGKFKTAR